MPDSQSRERLITEGFPGRLLEVTPAGDIVWEYFHPFGGVEPNSRFADSTLFKSHEYPASLVKPLLGS